MTGNVYEEFRQRFPADRSRPFIESAGGRVHSYRDLEETCGRYARVLRRLGVRKGDRVEVHGAPSEATVADVAKPIAARGAGT